MQEEYRRYEKTVTVACVNYHAIRGNKAANLEKMEAIIRRASSQGSNVIIFPELALSGYDCNPTRTYHRSMAETIPGPATEEISKVAKEQDVYVIFGMPERAKKKPETLYISAAIVGPEGLLGAYRKIHLAPPPRFTEQDCFVGGNQLPVFETRYGPIGIQICYDFWFFPELSRILALKGARIIINSCGSPSGLGKGYFIVQQTGCRAIENTVFAASANLVGKDLTTTFDGHSCIAGPDVARQVAIYAEAAQEEVVVSATLNFEALSFRRAGARWDKERRSALILREMQKLAR